MHPRVCSLGLLLAATVAVGGCGDSAKAPLTKVDGSPESKVAAVIADLGKAARDRDGDRICEQLFTSNLRISVAKASKTTCAKEVGANIFGSDTSFTVGSVKVDGDTATATVTDQRDRASKLVLQRDGRSWRIARIG